MTLATKLFNSSWYLQQNPDVAAAVEAGDFTAQQHFELFGKDEGRAPGPLFNPEQYLSSNPDVKAAVDKGEMSAYEHFVNWGASEGRSSVAAFDADFYLAQNPDVQKAVDRGDMTAIEHFILYGHSEPRTFTPALNLQKYLEANQDVAEAVERGDMSVANHLLTYGVAEGRDLGNGLSLTSFAKDPVFQEAIAAGDFQAALARVDAVAPFIPTFERPAGWAPSADTPIPTDFVPVEGESLVIPSEVTVPDGITLPPTFGKPYDVAYGSLSDVAQKGGFLFAGTTNPANDFLVSSNSAVGIELGLDVRYARDSAEVAPVAGNHIFAVDVGRQQDARFAYSVASTDATITSLLATYDFKMLIDTDPTEAQEWLTFSLATDPRDEGGNNISNSPFQWVRSDGGPIVDDGGNEFVTQNIEAFQFFNGNEALKLGGMYDVKLQAFAKGTSEYAVAESGLTVKVLPLTHTDTYGDLSENATQGAGNYLYAGTTNPSDGFVLSRNLDAGIELGLDVRLRGDGTAFEPVDRAPSDGPVVFNVDTAAPVRFAYSVASLAEGEAEIDLTNYEYKLKIDTDSTEATNFITFSLVKQDTSGKVDPSNPSPYEWVQQVAVGETALVITDDGGNDGVTQNIQAIDWYLDEGATLEDGDQYTVQLEAYAKGTEVIVAQSAIIVQVGTVEPSPDETVAFA